MSEGLNTLAKGNRIIFDGTNALYMYGQDYSVVLGAPVGTIGVPLVAIGMEGEDLQFAQFTDGKMKATLPYSEAVEGGSLPSKAFAVGGVDASNNFKLLDFDIGGYLHVNVKEGVTQITDGNDTLDIAADGSIAVSPIADSTIKIYDGTNSVAVNSTAQDNPESSWGLVTQGCLYAFSGTAWKRIQTGGSAASASVSVAPCNDSYFMISKDTSANATGNRLWVTSNVDQIGGTAVNVNGGAKDAGTQTVILATDDPAVTALQVMDDWDDGSDHCQVDIAAQTLTAVAVSADSSANAAGNPIFTELSDGTNAISVTNPLDIQISQDGTNPVDASHPLPVSKDLNANATGNRIWVTSNVDQIGGTAVNVNGGAKDAGTQTVILATDDPAVTALQVMDDWDSSDTCKTTKSAITTHTPAATTGTAVAGSAVTVLASTEVLDYPNWTIYLKNAGGGNGGDLTDADVQVSPDETEWISLTWTSADTLSSGESGCYSVAGGSYRYVRVQATAGADPNDSTCDCWITCNNG